MKKLLFVFYLVIIGCGVLSNNIKKIDCYIQGIQAPSWVCYQSPFEAVVKLKVKKVTFLKQEEAYSIAINKLINKLTLKATEFVRKIGINDKKNIQKIKEFIKSYVIINSMEDGSWYSNGVLYVRAKVNKKNFKKEFLSLFKTDKKLKEVYDEVF